MKENGLFVVATPIGNLQDITLRALEILGTVDLIVAEDTRHTRGLLQHHGIKTAMQSLHEHNEAQVVPQLLERILAGASIALVSDAGTPLISDPGFRLVQAARARALPVYTVPGASAVTAALSVAGLPTDRFVFEGFLPARQAARRKHLEMLKGETRTLVCFESTHRILECLQDCREVFGADRQAAICRELTKQFETVLLAPLGELCQRLTSDPDQCRGEFVVLVTGHVPSADARLEAGRSLGTALMQHLPLSQAARIAADLSGAPRRELYALLGQPSPEDS